MIHPKVMENVINHQNHFSNNNIDVISYIL